MKVKLLNDGGFEFLKNVEMPVEVNAISPYLYVRIVRVTTEELLRVGATDNCRALHNWSFSEFEVIE